MYLGAAVRIANGGSGNSIFLPRAFPMPGPMPVWRPPTPTPVPAPLPAPAPVVSAPDLPIIPQNAGSPVPAGFPTNQLFVNSNGSFWQFNGSQWVNVGTPYNTGAGATPAAPPPSPTGASTFAPVTVAPAAVPASSAPIITSTYQDLLNWLNEDSLLSTIGFAGIPNWITSAGVALLIYKVSNKSGRR